MASIKFILRSKEQRQVPIYVSVSLSRDSKFRERTGLTIEPQDWSNAKGFPKQNRAELKRLHDHLKKLESHLFNQLNFAQTEGYTIDKEFIQESIENCFNRKSNDDTQLFLSQVVYFIDQAPKKKVRNKSTVGLSENTIKNWKSFEAKIKRFEAFSKKRIKLEDDPIKVVEGFKNWAYDIEGYSDNTVGKDLAFFRQIYDESERRGLSIHPKARLIESYTASSDDHYIVTLTNDELRKIETVDLKREALKNVRLWLLIGCELGQRGGDLLKIDFHQIREKSGIQLIDVYQSKTKKWVTVPLTPSAKRHLETGFPYKISLTKFNQLLKELLKEGGFNEIIKGKKVVVDDKSKRKRSVLGKFPKHELITAHSCRRSFATNYYKKIPTPIIMGITGHSKESTFLKYINKPKDKDDNALQFLKYIES